MDNGTPDPTTLPEAGRTTSLLPVKLTEQERIDRGTLAARARREVQSLTDAAKAAANGFKERIAGKEADLLRALTAVETGEEQREVPCVERIDYPGGALRVYRLDTGEEVRDRRKALSDYELASHVTLEVDWPARTMRARCRHSGTRVECMDRRMSPDEIDAERARRQCDLPLGAAPAEGSVRVRIPTEVWDGLSDADQTSLEGPRIGVALVWHEQDGHMATDCPAEHVNAVRHRAQVLKIKLLVDDPSKAKPARKRPEAAE